MFVPLKTDPGGLVKKKSNGRGCEKRPRKWKKCNITFQILKALDG